MFFLGGNPLTPFLFLAVLDTIISLLGFDPCLFKSSRNCSTSVLSFFIFFSTRFFLRILPESKWRGVLDFLLRYEVAFLD